MLDKHRVHDVFVPMPSRLVVTIHPRSIGSSMNQPTFPNIEEFVQPTNHHFFLSSINIISTTGTNSIGSQWNNMFKASHHFSFVQLKSWRHLHPPTTSIASFCSKPVSRPLPSGCPRLGPPQIPEVVDLFFRTTPGVWSLRK